MVRVAFLLAALVLLPETTLSDTAQQITRKERRTNNKNVETCRSSLAGLYNCIQLYTRDHGSRLPRKDNAEGVRELIKSGATVNDFICGPYKGKRLRKLEDFEEERLPYLYFGGVDIKNALKSCPKIVLFCDKPTTKHINVLLADGTIVELQPKRYNRKITSCVDIIQLLDIMYKYPNDIFKSLLAKAKRMDENLFGKKPNNSSKR